VRIIAATNTNLEQLVEKGAFREDLYWRLNVVTILVPPLRDRKDDIENLVHYFIQKYNIELSKAVKGTSPDLLNNFSEYHWPGNVRELQGVINRGMVMCQKDFLSIEDCEWPPQITSIDETDRDVEALLTDAASLLLKKGGVSIYKNGVSEFECILVRKALEMTNGNQVLTAKLLGISRNTLRSKIDKD
jgi:transcriptional regulator with PAS, ATPase and Fis domain